LGFIFTRRVFVSWRSFSFHKAPCSCNTKKDCWESVQMFFFDFSNLRTRVRITNSAFCPGGKVLILQFNYQQLLYILDVFGPLSWSDSLSKPGLVKDWSFDLACWSSPWFLCRVSWWTFIWLRGEAVRLDWGLTYFKVMYGASSSSA
jgi:hypothetical protein